MHMRMEDVTPSNRRFRTENSTFTARNLYLSSALLTMTDNFVILHSKIEAIYRVEEIILSLDNW